MKMNSNDSGKKIDVLFVNPPSLDGSIYIRDINRSGRKSRERIIWPQTSLAYLAAMISDKHTVDILDCIAENMNWDEFKKYLRDEKPKYLVTNAITSSITNDLNAAKLAKEIGSKTIAIGPHVTELPKETLEKYLFLDFIIRGEAEITIKELIDAIENEKNLNNIKGIAFRKKGKIKINKERPLIKNLDNLPLPRHDLLPINKYVFPFIANKFTFVISSRGCPYFCTFCRQPIMWKRKIRSRSADNIIKELRMLKKLNIKNFIFHSDTFTIDKGVIIYLCKKMIEENLNFRWACNSRVDTVDKEMLKWMKKAGCWMVAYGIESGSQKILDNVKKGATVKQAEHAVKIAKEVGIKVYGYFILGLPGETKETIDETIEFSKNLPLAFAIFHVASPYPGTVFYDECVKNNWLTISKWEEINQGGLCPVNYPGLSGDEIMNGIKRAYKEWYFRPKVIFELLREVKNFKDLKHLIKIGLDHIRWS